MPRRMFIVTLCLNQRKLESFRFEDRKYVTEIHKFVKSITKDSKKSLEKSEYGDDRK